MGSFFNSYLIHSLERETTQLLFIFIVVLWCSIFIIGRIKMMSKKYPPGPIGLPFVGSLPFLGSEPHKTMAELGKKYGNIFSLYMGTKYTVVLNDFETMKEGLSHLAALDRETNLFEHVVGGIGFEELNGQPWKEQRRFCMQVMRDLGIGKGAWEDVIHDEISSCLEDLAALNGKPTDVSRLLSTSISSNVISLLIGRRLQKDKEHQSIQTLHDFSKVVFKYMGPSNPATLVPGFRKFMEFFKLGGFHDVPAFGKKANGFIKEEINRRKTSMTSRETEDFINRYLDEMQMANEPNGKQRYAFSDRMLEGNMNILFLGASDTIFNSVNFLFRLLAAHPDLQKKIHEEVDCVLGQDGRANYEERRKTPYTFASILEAQRWSTIVPLSTPRLVSEDFELREYTIPKGAQILGNTWAVHNDTRYWKEPEKLLPERFLTEDGSKLLPRLPDSYVPFSVGRRNCPGETIAMMEVYLYLCSVMQKFIISAPPGEEVNFKIINGLVVQLEPQKLCFSLRKT